MAVTSNTRRYAMRADYIHGTHAATVEVEAGDYWTDERLRISDLYQFDVYRKAYEVVNRYGRGAELLDVGCGPATKHTIMSKIITPANVTLVDQSTVQELVSKKQPSMHFFAINLESPKNSLEKRFDVVLCADVIEHLLDPIPCLEFLKAHLKPNGRLILSTPERHRLLGRHKTSPGHPCHVREWNFNEFAEFLKSQSLAICEHYITSQKRTARLTQLMHFVLDKIGISNSAFSCQVAVCRLGVQREL